ncbi:aspartate--tRNA ligase [Polaribacter porphyrae]|uniref:Aspartate--tRNA ligase n=1 Tax=Polaribacter porphyrae TaxID=1137780 RepID=A0A2S7WRM9_9FLAO|nr:aspartate--tRNA ligase [Polaribacter porphyrae]PQJ80249.1 aspartate--tRNA ligase [Polaribacter porphyrae]
MYRSHSCGELRASHINTEVTLAGWVQKSRDKGFMIWVDLRDRYGITQLIFDEERTPKAMMEKAKSLGREFVIQVTGTVIERESKNDKMATGAIEVLVSELEILNKAKLPPFTIEGNTDGGEDIRMKYRYLDIRRNPVKDSLIFRHKVTMEVRKYLSNQEFIEIETPYLIKSTPEGARDFVVPSRMNEGQFYALPQSPQTFKQLLMVGGMDKYFQIVKCFRDEDLRADRQPEFTQIDCEMAFVEQEDILNIFEGLTRHLLKEINGIEIEKFPRMLFDDAMRLYGNDKPDIRFGMKFGELNEVTQHKDFGVFNNAELVVGIAVPGGNKYTRKEIDNLIKWVKRPQVGALGMIYCRVNEDGTFKSSVDKFYNQEDLAKWVEVTGAKPGDLVCVLSGETNKVRAQMSALRMEMAERLELRDPKVFAPLWVIDFPLLELDEETGHYHAMHHPFTSPKEDTPEGFIELARQLTGAKDKELRKKYRDNLNKLKANAYDLVLNGNEIGGGSIRIHDKKMQANMFKLLGFSEEEARAQFGFLMDAFEYGAPPHGGLAFGLDRLVAILGGQETIRDFIAFPKNNSGRDVMIDAPAFIDDEQLKELSLKLNIQK